MWRWPIDGNSYNGGWFRAAINPQVTNITSTSATINWTTPVDANSEVTWTHTGIWWDWEDSQHQWHHPDGKVSDSNMVMDHHKTITLNPNYTDYEFRIRSTNDVNNPPDVNSQIIWGYVDSFITAP